MIRVGILRGGTSGEYDLSLKTGGTLLSALLEKGKGKYDAFDMLVTKDGEWHLHGLPITPDELKENVDVIWNALHGGPGEDGRVQELLETLQIPYVGGTAESAPRTLDKSLAKEVFREMGVKTPEHHLLERNSETTAEEMAKLVHSKLSPPWIVKPLRGGASIATYHAGTFADLAEALSRALSVSKSVLVEEFIFGKEFFVGMIDRLRGQEVYTLFPMEVMKTGKILDEHAVRHGTYHTLLPRMEREQKQLIEDTARRIHQAFPLRHLSSMDFILSGRGLYALEVDSTPHLFPGSRMDRAMEAGGVSIYEMMDHLLQVALNKK